MTKKKLMGRKGKKQTTSLIIIWRAEDTDIIRRLDEVIEQGKETKADYIRRLVRKDIRERQRRAEKKKQSEVI